MFLFAPFGKVNKLVIEKSEIFLQDISAKDGKVVLCFSFNSYAQK